MMTTYKGDIGDDPNLAKFAKEDVSGVVVAEDSAVFPGCTFLFFFLT